MKYLSSAILLIFSQISAPSHALTTIISGHGMLNGPIWIDKFNTPKQHIDSVTSIVGLKVSVYTESFDLSVDNSPPYSPITAAAGSIMPGFGFPFPATPGEVPAELVWGLVGIALPGASSPIPVDVPPEVPPENPPPGPTDIPPEVPPEVPPENPPAELELPPAQSGALYTVHYNPSFTENDIAYSEVFSSTSPGYFGAITGVGQFATWVGIGLAFVDDQQPGANSHLEFGQWDVTYVIESHSVVPEPASWALMIAGFGLVGLSMRRRQTVLKH